MVTLKSVCQDRLGTISFKIGTGVEPFEFGVLKREEHAIGATSSTRDQRSPAADAQLEPVYESLPRVDWRDLIVEQDCLVHEEAIEERIDTAITHRFPRQFVSA